MEIRAKLCKRDYDYDFDNCPKIPLYALKQRKEKTLKSRFSYSEITCADYAPLNCRFDLRYTTKIRIAEEASAEHAHEQCPDGVASASTIVSQPSLAASKSSPDAHKGSSVQVVEEFDQESQGQLPQEFISGNQAILSQQGMAMPGQIPCPVHISQQMLMASGQQMSPVPFMNAGGIQGMSQQQMAANGGQARPSQQVSFHDVSNQSGGPPFIPPEPPVPLPIQFPMVKPNIPFSMNGITPLPESFPPQLCSCNMQFPQMPTPFNMMPLPNMPPRPQENVSLNITSQGQIPPGMAFSMPQDYNAGTSSPPGMNETFATNPQPYAGSPESSQQPLNEFSSNQPPNGSGSFQPLATSSRNEEPKKCCRKRSLGWCKKKEQNESDIDAGQVDGMQPTISKEEKLGATSSTILK